MGVNTDSRSASLHADIDSILSVLQDDLARIDLAELSFKTGQQNIDRLRRILVRLSACDFDLLSNNTFQQCAQFVSEVRDVFNRMKGFAPYRSSTAPQNERDAILQSCVNVFNTANDRLLGVFAIAAPTLHETGSEVRLILDSAKSSATALIDTVKSQTDDARKEVEETLKSVRAATGAIGIEKQAEVFTNAAREHATGRKYWLAATGLLAGVTIVALLLNWFFAYRLGPPASSVALVQLAVAKVLVFSFLLSAVLWSGRIYRSHQHNYVLNKHRQNALETFQLFARAAEHDPETKNMVLLQATKSIFTPQPTGFLSGEKESDGTSPQILEVIRSLSSSTK